MQPVIRHLHKTMARQLSRKRAIRIQGGPIVSFTFDDFPRSALTSAGAMLEAEGLHGTYYAATGLASKKSAVGEIFSPSDLSQLIASGHELACHTFSHLSCHAIETLAWVKECQRNRENIYEITGGYKVQNFSFPFGDASLRAKLAVKANYLTCRSIDPGINQNKTDFAYLRANPMYSWIPTDKIKETIAQGIQQRAWIILYTHDVVSTPSKWGCTPQYFKEVLSFVLGSGAEVLTVAQAAQRFQVLDQ